MDGLDAMSAVLRNFKNIPCPNGAACSTPNCQWKHPWETTEPPTATAKSNIATSGSDVDADGGGPRKRQRVDEAGRDRPKSRLNSEVQVTTGIKSVSPPPLKRKAASQLTQTPVKRPQPAAANDSSSSAPVTTGTPVSAPAPVNPSPVAISKTPKKAPRKPESLNPRHLKSSPATHEFRYKALRMLHEQLVHLNTELKKDANDEEEKLVMDDQELIWLALDIEEHAAVDKPSIYTNIIKNRITSYKRLSVAAWKDERLAEKEKEAATANPMSSSKGRVVSGPPIVINTGLTPEQEVAFLQRLITPIAHYPQWDYVPVAPTKEAIEKARQGVDAAQNWERCDRCNANFAVFPDRREDGSLTTPGKCDYHPGKEDKAAKIFRCCYREVGNSVGCEEANTHVFKITDPPRLSLVLPFMETPPNPSAPTDRAVCIDCEMGYTAKGFELLRLTATSWPDGKVILDVFVQPFGAILDLNSKFSGVQPGAFANAPLYVREYEPSPTSGSSPALKEGEVDESPAVSKALIIPPTSPLHKVDSPAVARDLLFRLISPSTPLIGHGIDNDLMVTRIIHPTIIDTVLLYPLKNPKFRAKLQFLAADHLKQEIQGSKGGHDSAEDARAAGDLVRLRVMTEWDNLKKKGWTFAGTRLLKPGETAPKEEEKKGEVTEGAIGVKKD